MRLFILLTFFVLIQSLNYNYNINRLINKSLFIKNTIKPTYSFIFFPGFGIKPESYKNLCNLINIKTNNQTNFLILDYKYMFPLELNYKSNEISLNAINFFKSNNIISEKIYFIGHSAGAYYAINPAEKYSDGLIQLGCVLNSKGELFWGKNSLKKYNKPVLTLLGEKDGYFSYLHSIQEFQDISIEDFHKKPIIIEKNINHLQMADNIPSLYSKIFKQNDFKSPISLMMAHDKISDSIISFITNDTSNYIKSYNSYNKINNYLNINNNIDELCKKIQYKILNPINDIKINIKNTFYNSLNHFIISKPKIDNNGMINIHSYLSKTYKNNLYSKSLWIKMKNQDSIINNKYYLHTLIHNKINAKEINKYIINEYFQDNCPINIIFEEDLLYDNTASTKWLLSEISIKYKDDKLYIKSPVLYTNENTIPRYSGMIYMKLLTPQMVQEIKSIFF